MLFGPGAKSQEAVLHERACAQGLGKVLPGLPCQMEKMPVCKKTGQMLTMH